MIPFLYHLSISSQCLCFSNHLIQFASLINFQLAFQRLCFPLTISSAFFPYSTEPDPEIVFSHLLSSSTCEPERSILEYNITQ